MMRRLISSIPLPPLVFILIMFLVFPLGTPWATMGQMIYYDEIPNGRTAFGNALNQFNASVIDTPLNLGSGMGSSWNLGDFTIATSDGSNRGTDNFILANPSPGVPGGDAIKMDPNGSPTSGLTITFNTPINAFGIDIQGWAASAAPSSSLFVSIDGGPPILIGVATTAHDNPGYAQYAAYETFIGIMDDTTTFSSITIYGDNTSENLYGGGLIKYAILPIIGNTYVNTAQPTPLSSLATYLDQYDNSGTLQTVATILNSYPTPQLINSLKHIFPVDTVAGRQAGSAGARQSASTVTDRIGTVLGGIRTSQFKTPGPLKKQAPNSLASFSQRALKPILSGLQSPGGKLKPIIRQFSAMEYQEFEQGKNGIWIQGVGGQTSGKKNTHSNGYEADRYGVLGGYEFAIDSTRLLGFYTSILYTDMDLGEGAGKTRIKNFMGGIYGQKITGAWKLAASLGYGIAKYKSTRHIIIPPVVESPKAQYKGTLVSLGLTTSRLYDHNCLKIEPFFQLDYLYNHTNSYRETQGGGL